MAGRKAPSARAASLRVISLTLQGRDLQAALNRELNARLFSDPDRHLTTQLSYGFFRYQLRLMYVLSCFMTRKVDSLPGPIQRALCLGIYEICFLSRVPDFATVHWHVQQIKKAYSPKLGGLANAVLRRTCRERDALRGQDFYLQDHPEEATFLSRYFACPEWIVRLCLDTFGPEDTQTLLDKTLHPPPVGLRLNPSSAQGTDLHRQWASKGYVHKDTPWGLALQSPPDRMIRRAEDKGLLTRQSLAAQEALSRELPDSWPQPIWDACSGRGLKTGQLLELGCQKVWASDMHAHKVAACRAEILRLHLPNIPLFAADATKPPLGRNRAQSILLDVPCSGLGVLSRRPDIKAKRRPKDLSALTTLQGSMLRACLSALPRGGLLVYISCTLCPEENENIIRTVLDQNPGRGKVRSIHLPDPTSPLGEYFFSASIQV
ncbi:MAG: transcription antitermination factor NusB [Desulfovermiculus sp.]